MRQTRPIIWRMRRSTGVESLVDATANIAIWPPHPWVTLYAPGLTNPLQSVNAYVMDPVTVFELCVVVLIEQTEVVELFEITAANGSSTPTLGGFSLRSFHVPNPSPKNDAIFGVEPEG